MTCLCTWRAICLSLHISFLVMFEHIIGVSMVSSEHEHSTNLLHCLHDSSNLKIQSFHRADYSFKHTSMSHHVSIREVELHEIPLSTFDLGNQPVGDFSTFHPRTLLIRHNV